MSYLKPSILLVIEGTYPWYRGGVSEWIYQYLRTLKDYEFHILQIATDEFQQLDPKNALYPLTDNVKSFKRVHPPKLTSSWDSDKNIWFSSLDLDISLEDFAFIHVTNTGFAGWLGKELSVTFSTPLILTEHALYWKEVEKGAVALECGYQIPDTFEAKSEIVNIFKDIASEVYLTSKEVISVSRVNIPYQIEFGAKSPRYIPNGIPKSLLVDHKVRSEVPVIGWIGRCAEMKNPKLYFEIAEEFRSRFFNSNFLMLLSDANEKELEKEVRELANQYAEVEVIWNESAFEYLDRIDILLITSHNESQPLVMFEAISNKALPAGWEVGDLTAEFGLVVPEGTSIQTLVDQIIQIWMQNEKFENLVEQKFKLISKKHTWESIFNQYDDLFQEIVFETSIQ